VAQIRTQTLLVLSEDEKAAFQKVGEPKLISDATKPFIDALKTNAKAVAAIGKGTPTQEDIENAGAALSKLRGVLEILPASDARALAEEHLGAAQDVLDEVRGLLSA
jgi:hypothetical protein